MQSSEPVPQTSAPTDEQADYQRCTLLLEGCQGKICRQQGDLRHVPGDHEKIQSTDVSQKPGENDCQALASLYRSSEYHTFHEGKQEADGSRMGTDGSLWLEIAASPLRAS